MKNVKIDRIVFRLRINEMSIKQNVLNYEFTI